MKVFDISCLTTCMLLLSSHLVCGSLKAERTRQLLLNIRSHLEKKVEEIVQQKECDSGLTLCDGLKKGKEEEKGAVVVDNAGDVKNESDDNDDDDDDDDDHDDDDDDDDSPPPPVKPARGHHKPDMKVTTKDVIQSMIHKVHKHHTRRQGAEQLTKIEENVNVKETPLPKIPEPKISEPKIRESKIPGPKKEKLPIQKDDNEDSDKKIIKNREKSDIDIKPTKKPQRVRKKKENEKVIFPQTISIFPPANMKVDNDLCRKHSRVYVRQLLRYKLWALMMYDASAKLPSGILEGNINQLGHFDECLTVNAVFKDRKEDGGIKGKFCLVNIDIQSTSHEGALQHAVYKAQSYGFIKSTIEDEGHFIPRFTTINWGVCVPHSCNNEDVEKAINDILLKYNESHGVSFGVKVDDGACVSRKDLAFEFRIDTLLAILFYTSFLTLVGYATYKDMIPIENEDEPPHPDVACEQGKCQRLVGAFSLKRTIHDLFETEKESIKCIHGIKAIFTGMLFLAHKTIPLAMTPFINRVALTKISNEVASVILRTSIIYTDGFLIVSGALTSFNVAKEIETKGSISWLGRGLSRYIRLTPPFIAILIFYTSIAENLGNGPMWVPLVGKNAEICRENFWTNLLYIQNFFEFEDMCAPQTHQLALDMQFSLVAPLFVYLLHNYGLLGFMLMQTIFLVSATLCYISTINNQLTLVFFHGVTVSQLYRTANLLYSQALYRATPYLMGVIIGYYLQTKRDVLEEKLSKPLVAIGWIAAACFGLLSIASPSHLSNRNYTYDVQEAAHYSALSPISWSLAMAWTIMACHLGFGGRLNEFLSSRPFIVISRLSYAIYLVQFLVFNHNVGLLRTAQVFSVTNSFSIGEIASIIISATLLTLIFDLPMRDVKKVIMEIKWRKDETETEGNGNNQTEENKEEADEAEVEEEEEEEEQEQEEELEEDKDLEEDHPLRRSTRMHFDGEGGSVGWKGDKKVTEDELEKFWNQDED